MRTLVQVLREHGLGQELCEPAFGQQREQREVACAAQEAASIERRRHAAHGTMRAR